MLLAGVVNKHRWCLAVHQIPDSRHRGAADHFRKEVIAGKFSQPVVKAIAVIEKCGQVLFGSSACLRMAVAAQLLDLHFGQTAFRSKLCRKRFNTQPNQINIAHLRVNYIADNNASACITFGKPHGGEQLQRRSDRCAADAKLCRKRFFGKLFARLEFSGQNRFAQHMIGFIRKRLPFLECL